jgi:molybdopterin/thiamine biosynthesis adenylyltransferase
MDQARLQELFTGDPHVSVIDTYDTQLKELFVLDHPPLNLNKPQLEKEFPAYRDAHYTGREPWQVGVWAYLPWRDVLLHLLPDADFQHVRTARNRNLIPPEEQEKYYHSTIGIAGLSVGNSCALALVLMGGGKRLRLADPDTLELTNLNRIRGSIADLTRPKVFMTAQQIYELDPYAGLTLYREGLTKDNIQRFFDGPPQLDVVIDEIDNLEMKLRIREEAQKRRIPVVMATDNGDSGLLDVERYDLDPDIQPFHGRVPEQILKRIRAGEKIPLPIVGATIGEHLVGWGIVEPRMQVSLLEIGKTIPTWPQLGGAALLNGVLVAVAVRKILTGQPVIDSRAVLSLASALIPDYDSPAEVNARRKATEEFVQTYHALLNQFAGGK